MIRRLTLAAALAGALTAAGAAAATALPVSSASSAGRGACVAVHDIDTAYCVSNPAPGLPKPKVPKLPELP